jgi:predicted transcriptional regulator
MKTAISIPDEQFHAAERLAQRLGLSRSELYQKALARFLVTETAEDVTAALDAVYGDSNISRLDPALLGMQFRSLPSEPW